ncbi:MAG: MOSC domain-containing protein [Nocardioides sp.]|nr:MOSC domain-containing protein [Nocardioides sp.]
MQLTGLAVHPLKSGAIRPVLSAEVLAHGLADDRAWMLVDRDGLLVSAREEHETFRIVADTPATEPGLDAVLRLRAPGLPDLRVARPDRPPVAVRLHSLDLFGTPADDEAHAWVGRALDRDDLRLVWCHDPTERRLQPGFSEPGDHAAYPDAFPVTFASLASLRQLNDWIVEGALERGEEAPQPLPMERFRPNLIIDGDEPFAEDGWTGLTVGDVHFRVAKQTDRCVMTTIDPTSLLRAKEPIRTLARHRLVGGRTMFAAHLIPLTTGRISVGDPVSVS